MTQRDTVQDEFPFITPICTGMKRCEATESRKVDREALLNRLDEYDARRNRGAVEVRFIGIPGPRLQN